VKYGLANLYQMCKQNPRGDWNAIVQSHFDSALNATKESSALVGSSFEKQREYISVRIYPEEYINYVGKDNAIYQKLADGIVKVLVFDYPSAISNIKPSDAAVWKKDNNYLFDLGLKNANEKYHTEITKDTSTGYGIYLVSSDDFFCTNTIIEFDKNPQLIGKQGSLIGVPNRNSVVSYPIDDKNVVNVIEKMIMIVKGMEGEGPGSISSNLYWYKNGKFINLPYTMTSNSINFQPPSEFIDMLNGLVQ